MRPVAHKNASNSESVPSGENSGMHLIAEYCMFLVTLSVGDGFPFQELLPQLR